ncbi:MAG TPA: DUF427 domain-containing protein [Acidimicrobiales bacterium]|jgi:uncharacterized protein (DUF427 family)|nr:DUF427 domain-containing protein [Acidimicrobiales bacterium]
MSLTTGRGPLSGRPAGRFSVPVPFPVTYIEPFPRRVRAVKGGKTVVDSERVLLLHRPGQPPTYALLAADVNGLPSTPEADAPGYVTVSWDAVDGWFEEEEQIFGHPRNPYHRVDSLRSQRRLVVELAGETLVDTTRTLAVYETALDPRLYVAPEDVRMDFLERSTTVSYCPYKGTCSYWSARIGNTLAQDVAWSYEDPLPESIPLARYLSFDDTRASVRHDLPSGS